jgi:hypothetical protein
MASLESKKRFRKYQIKYYKDNYKTFSIKIRTSNGSNNEIVNKLLKQDSISRYVRELIEEDIKQNGM